MGCDIHIFAEFKIGKKGAWKLAPCHYYYDADNRYNDNSEPQLSTFAYTMRDYDLFNDLAGVRGDKVVQTLGFPQDICEDLKKIKDYHFDQPDSFGYHTPHHMSYKDFRKTILKHGYEIADVDKNPCRYVPGDYNTYGSKNVNYGTILKYIDDMILDYEMDRKLLGIQDKMHFRIIMFFDS